MAKTPRKVAWTTTQPDLDKVPVKGAAGAPGAPGQDGETLGLLDMIESASPLELELAYEALLVRMMGG